MNGNESLKDQILNSVDDKLIADNCSKIKSVYFLNEKEKETNKKNGFKWGLIGTSLTAALVCAIVIPAVVLTPTNDVSAEVPQTVSNQSKDISFGVSSIAEVLSSQFAEDQAVAKAKVLNRHDEPRPEDFWHGDKEEDDTNYLVTVEQMYSLVTPYLSTVNNLLNGTEFPYQIENNDSEEYPFKIGNFIFNVVEDKEQEGEVVEEETEKTEENLVEEVIEQLKVKEFEEPEQPEEPIEQPEEPVDDEEDEIDDRPDFTFIREFYEITGQLVVDDVTYPVTGQQITFGCKSEHDDEQYSELYLNAQKDETHEVTIFKSTYSYSFANSFKNISMTKDYTEEAYAYLETEINTVTRHNKEYQERKVINAVEITSSTSNKTINEEIKKSNNEVYLSLESSYEDDDGIENTIDADLSFRLPNEKEEKPHMDFHSFFDTKEEEEPIEEEPIEQPEEPVEEEVAENEKAFRVDYECKVIKNTPYENKEEYGHGQHRDNRYSLKRIDQHNEYTTVFGSFYVYKDIEGNLIDPDFATEGRHQVIGNGGYNHDWYDVWDW